MRVSFRGKIGSRAFVPLIVAAALVLGLSAGSIRAAQTRQEKPLQYQVAVTLKLVQVYATGKGGVPVTDLTAADFEVIDNGKSYPVTALENHFFEAAEITGEAAATGPQMGRKFLLVFDFAFMDMRAIQRARTAALGFLDGEILPSDEIGLVSYSVNKGLVLHEYLTSDHARVRAIVEGFGGKPQAGRAENLSQYIYAADWAQMSSASSAKSAALAADTGGVPSADSQFYVGQVRLQAGQTIGLAGRGNYVDQARQFLVALGQMAKVLRSVPGFKNIILFSGGIPRQYLYGKRGGATLGEWTTPEQLASQMKAYDGAQADSALRDDHIAMIKEFKAANCPVYTIDVSRLRREGDVLTQTGVSGEELREFEGADSLRQVAGGTGGKFYANTMEDARIAKDIQNSTAGYYVLGYNVPETWDGKFHKIKVKVARTGVDINTQGGYYSAKPFKEYSNFEKLLHVVDLALGESSQFQAPYDIPVAALPLMVKGWPQVLVFTRASQAVNADVLGKKAEAYLLLMDEKGDISSIKRFQLAVPEKGKGTLVPSFLLPIKPGRYSCRMVIRNVDTGRGARGLAPLNVLPPVTAVLVLDPPLLVAPETDAMDLTVLPGGALAGLYGYDPNAFAPLVGDITAGTARLHAALRINGGAAAVGLTVSASLLETSTSVRTEVPLSVLKEKADGQTKLLLVELATGGLKPGLYTLEIAAKEPGTGESATSSLAITVK